MMPKMIKRIRALLKRWDNDEIEILGKINDEPTGQPHIITEQDKEKWNRDTVEGVEKLEYRAFDRLYPILAVVLGVAITVVLLITVANLPEFGSPDAPTNNEVAERYLAKGIEETGAVNAVAGMIINYRGFDTLGESHVLFVAVCVVMAVMMGVTAGKQRKQEMREEKKEEMLFDLTKDPILNVAVRILVPIILLFGVYIMFNGHLSPGGGFSGGSVVGAGLILHSIGLGFHETERFFNDTVYKIIKVFALVLYSVIMVWFFYTGANGLNDHIPLGTPGNIFSSGIILPINIAVGFEVACTMYGLYSLFKRGRI
jgi:multisubunit Na+/H+ antiporter MnhB subunit